jgi:hypothetical protein
MLYIIALGHSFFSCAYTWSRMVLHILKHLSHALSNAESVDEVDEVEIGQLTIESLHLDVEVS